MCGSMTVLLPKVVIGGRIGNVCQVKCVCFCAVLKETCICILWVEVLTPDQELIFTGAVQSICTGVKTSVMHMWIIADWGLSSTLADKCDYSARTKWFIEYKLLEDGSYLALCDPGVHTWNLTV